MIGMHGSYAAGMALDHSDLIVVLGARFSDRVAGDREKFGKAGQNPPAGCGFGRGG